MKIYHHAKNKLKQFHFNTNLLEDADWTSKDPLSETDIPRFRKGNVGGQVFISNLYTIQIG